MSDNQLNSGQEGEEKKLKAESGNSEQDYNEPLDISEGLEDEEVEFNSEDRIDSVPRTYSNQVGGAGGNTSTSGPGSSYSGKEHGSENIEH